MNLVLLVTIVTRNSLQKERLHFTERLVYLEDVTCAMFARQSLFFTNNYMITSESSIPVYNMTIVM
jgi:hypothetical protein